VLLFVGCRSRERERLLKLVVLLSLPYDVILDLLCRYIGNHGPGFHSLFRNRMRSDYGAFSYRYSFENGHVVPDPAVIFDYDSYGFFLQIWFAGRFLDEGLQ
jgi:hypothetical protein